LRDREILDINSINIEGDDNKSRKYRKKKVNKLRKVEKRKWSLNYLTNMVGKGEK